MDYSYRTIASVLPNGLLFLPITEKHLLDCGISISSQPLFETQSNSSLFEKYSLDRNLRLWKEIFRIYKYSNDDVSYTMKTNLIHQSGNQDSHIVIFVSTSSEFFQLIDLTF